MKWIFQAVLWLLILSQTGFGQESPSVIGNNRAASTPYALLDSLESQFSVEFAYESNVELPALDANLIPENGTLEKTLESLFADTELEYVLQNELVLLRIKTSSPGLHVLSGKILDKETGKPLPFSGLIDSHGNHCYSNEQGSFEITFSPGKRPDSLYISYIGYKKTTIPVYKNQMGNIELEAQAEKIPLVYISSPLYPVEMLQWVQAERLTNEQNPSSLISGDISRQIQLKAGVTAHKDISSDIIIRGSEAYETMINLDGIVIYNPTHFYNLFSAINGAYIQNTFLFRNNLPIEFAGKTGGLVQLQSKTLDTPDFALHVNADLLGTAACLEIPVSSNSGILLAGRTSYTGLAQNRVFKTISGTLPVEETDQNRSLIESLSPDFNFYDLNAKYQSLLSENQSFDINFYFSKDRLSNLLRNENSRLASLNTYLFDFEEQAEWENLGISANYSFQTGERLQHKISLHYSQSSTNTTLAYKNIVETRNISRSFTFGNALDNSISDLHGNWNSKFRFGQQSDWEFGLEVGHYETRVNITTDSVPLFQQQSDQMALSHYQQLSGKIGLFNYQAGGRVTWLTGISRLVFDPRFAFSIKKGTGKKHIFHGAFSLNHQYLTQFSYENKLGQEYDFWVLPNDDFPILISYNTMLGYRWSHKGFKISTELYYKYRTGLSDYAVLKPGINGENPNLQEIFQFFYGRGKILGMDLSLSQNIGSYSTELNYTLSSNLNSFEEVFGGKYFPDSDHRLHQLKWINGYAFGGWQINGNLIYSSGKPYLDISKLDKEIPRKELDSKESLSYLPPYLRIDMGIHYSPPALKDKITIGLTVFNLLNRKNVYSIQYIRPFDQGKPGKPDFIPVGAESALLERTVNLGVKVTF